jgi:subtilisin family serine protease
MVTYRPEGALPAGWACPPGALAAAANQPNALLRANRQFEALTAALAARYGLVIRQQVYLGALNIAGFELPAGTDGSALLARLRPDCAGFISAVRFTPLLHASYAPDDPDFAAGADGPQWAHWKIRCQYAWNSALGDPAVVVGVVDTGVRLTHEELAGQVIDPADAFPQATCDLANADQSIEDNDGHGTFIAGLIGAKTDDGITIAGAAPHCRVLPIKISETRQSALLTDLIAGATLAGQLGARVISFSWGSTNYDDSEKTMVDQLTADGILFVAAAGNDGSYDVEYPARLTNAFCVGATDQSDNVTFFSDWGPDVDIAAPGVMLKSTGYAADNAYETGGSGTSYAAPLVAAGAALLWSYRPELTLPEVRNALQLHGAQAHNFASPIKRLDLYSALASVAVPDVVPSIGGVDPGGEVRLGRIPGQTTLDVRVLAPVDVTLVHYYLDQAPVGTAGPEDILRVSSSGGDFPVQFDVAPLANQRAMLRVEIFSGTGHKVISGFGPVWIFNQRGDIDGDGAIGDSDLPALRPLLGLATSDSGYVPYADSDQDGTITEADAAAIGYFYGQPVP